MAAFYAACGGSTKNNAATSGAAPAPARTVTAVAPLTGTSAAGGTLAIPASQSTPIPLAAGTPGGKLNLAQTLEPATLDPLAALSGGPAVAAASAAALPTPLRARG